MSLSATSIRRPVLTTVVMLVILLFGLLGLARLGLREYPAVDPPTITVTTSYRGADPEIIDSQITEPLEQAISGIAGIRTINSEARDGRSRITVEFTLDSDLETAANDVRDKVFSAVDSLPDDADPPSIEKADADASPIIFMAMTSGERSILETSFLAETVVKERMQTIPGVSGIRIFGEKRFAMRLLLDPERLLAHGVTPSDVLRAVQSQNVDLPSGRLEGASTELAMRTDGRLTDAAQFNDLIVRTEGGRQIRLRDVGHAELSAEDIRSGNVSLGVPMVGVAIVPQPNTNAIEIADEFFRRLPQVRDILPPDIDLEIGYDFTTFVRRSIVEVEETILVAFGLVTLIIFLFLRDWRTVIVPVAAIPVSIIFGFFVMYVMGFTINVLTLIALVLAIGLVCDDAIVMLENIYAKVEAGMEPYEAAMRGSQEVYFAIIATTLALAAVFAPIMFLQGLTGRLFREFAIVLVGCVLMSSFVSLSLSPMMCRLLLRPHQKHGLFFRLTEPIFRGMAAVYRFLLRGALAARWLVIPVLGAAVAGIVWAHGQLESELAPMEDRSNIRVNLRAPEGATYEYTRNRTEEIARHIETAYAAEVHRVFAITGRPNGPGSAILNVYLKEPAERTRSAFEILEDLSGYLQTIDGLRASPSMPPTIGDRRGGLPVQFVLEAPNLKAMEEVLPKFLEKASAHPKLRFVDSDLKTNRPQVRVTIDRARAAEMGVSVEDIARSIQLAFGDASYGKYQQGGRQYEVLGQLDRPDRNKPADLDRLHVRSASGELISLGNLVSIQETQTYTSIFRFNRSIAATISAGLADGVTLGEGIEAMEEVADEVLPPGFGTALTGQSREFAESSSSLLFVFIIALVLIYLVLAAQFESWMDPFIIMLTVPLSLIGALLSLVWQGQTLNVFSQIGIIMLIGLVTKNGILIVEFANQRLQAGLSLKEATLEASVARFRPILMTSLSTILGILPIAIAAGGASGSRQSLGIAVVGGLTLATALTLFVVPCVYMLLSSGRRHLVDGMPAPPSSGEVATQERARDGAETGEPVGV